MSLRLFGEDVTPASKKKQGVATEGTRAVMEPQQVVNEL